MKTICFISLLFMGFSVFAINPKKQENLVDHLSIVNKEWLKHQDLLKVKKVSFVDDNQRIQRHLTEVIQILRSKKHDFDAKALDKRRLLLDDLEIYAKRQVFPINLYHKERRPYFIDHLGTHCAVGYMMLMSGNENLAQRISTKENYAYIRDIQTNGVEEWAENHGFTVDELAWIQPGYMLPSSYAMIDGTTNGPVTNIENFYIPDSIYGLLFTGSFTELKGLPCLNIGYYQNNQLSCFGNGLDGKINDLSTNYGIYVSGRFPFENEFYHVAHFDGSNWNLIQIPNAEFAEGVCVKPSNWWNSLHKLDVVLFFENENKSEVWSIDTLMNYTKKAELNGRVFDINMHNNSVLVGHFDSVYVYNNNQIIDTLSCENIISYSTNYVFNNNISGPVSDTIKTVTYVNGVYYFGGTCNNNNDNTICISRCQNGVMQPIVTGGYLYDMFGNDTYFSVEKIRISEFDTDLRFSGDLKAGFFDNGSGFAAVNLISNSVYALNNFDGTVYDFIDYNGYTYFGGDFNTFLVRNLINEIDESGSIHPIFEVFPNPANDHLNIQGLVEIEKYQITDLSGKVLAEGNVSDNQINIENLESGSYILSVECKEKIWNSKFIKL